MTQTSHHHCATLQMWDKVIHADTAKEYRKDHNRLEKCKHKRPSTRTVRHWSSPLLSVNLRVFASICIVSLASKRISSTPFLCLSKEICVERKKSVETKWTKTTCKYSSHLLLSKTENGGKHENSVAISVVGHSASMAFVLSCNLACRVLMERLRKPSVKNATDVYRCNSKPTSLWSTRNSCGWISISTQFSSQTFPGKELLVSWTHVIMTISIATLLFGIFPTHFITSSSSSFSLETYFITACSFCSVFAKGLFIIEYNFTCFFDFVVITQVFLTL